MQAPASPSFSAALDALLAELSAGPGRLRAWSLAVTLFGDAAAPRGGALRLGAVQAVLGRLGVEPGALRTAMSRLARDGWLARERRGRASFYSLTAARAEELAAATRRIYAAGPPGFQEIEGRPGPLGRAVHGRAQFASAKKWLDFDRRRENQRQRGQQAESGQAGA